jgi:hypothetical protein
MPDRLNVRDAVHRINSGFCGNQPPQNQLDRSAVVSDGSCRTLDGFAFRLQINQARAADSLDAAARQMPIRVLLDSFEVGVNKLKFQRRAAAIKN